MGLQDRDHREEKFWFIFSITSLICFVLVILLVHFFHVPTEKSTQVSEEKLPIVIYGGKGCTCSDWVKRGCGEGICKKDERLEIRNCSPKGCQKESRCVIDEECSLSIFSIEEKVITGDLKWEVVKVKNRGNILKASESRYPILAEDKITEGKFIEVELIIENIGRQSHYFSPPKIYDEKEREFDRVVEASEWIPEDKICFSWDEIKPGFSKNCILIYEVAKDSINLWLYVPSTDRSEKGKFIYLGSF